MEKFSELIIDMREYAKRFNPFLYDFVRKHIPDRRFAAAINYSLKTIGERERPFLVKTVSELLNGQVDISLPIALASEFFISSGLIGDDFLDGANARWGFTSAWKKYGDRVVFLISEALQSLSISSLYLLGERKHISSNAWANIYERFAKVYRIFYSAQFSDITAEGDYHKKNFVTKLAIERTALLIKESIACSALLFKADTNMVACLENYGYNMGTAFQFRDDIIDFIGDYAKTGKPELGDLVNCQGNIVLSYAYTLCNQKDIAFIRSLIKQKINRRDKLKILTMLYNCGAIQRAIDEVGSYISKACKSISNLKDSPPKIKLMLFAELLYDTLEVFKHEH